MEDTRSAPDLWALVLAGGDGTRLREITRLLAGEPIPKQYCRITGGRSMLEATLDRIAPLAPAERTLAIVNRDHLPLADPQLVSLPPANVLVQPCNRDTGPGLLWSLLEIERRCPGAMVAVFPSDHYVARDAAFRTAVRHAAQLVARHPEKLALLGISPDHPASDYGYVLPARPVRSATGAAAFRVARFLEKPPPPLAQRIVERGALWNSFVMVFHTTRVLELLARLLPEEHRAMAEVAGDAERRELHYASATAWNFSSAFLARVASELLVVRAEDTGWSDWGTPRAIERTFAALDVVPPWHTATSVA